MQYGTILLLASPVVREHGMHAIALQEREVRITITQTISPRSNRPPSPAAILDKRQGEGKEDYLPAIARIIHIIMHRIQPGTPRTTILGDRTPARGRTLLRRIGNHIALIRRIASVILKSMQQTKPMADLMHRRHALRVAIDIATGQTSRQDVTAVLHVVFLGRRGRHPGGRQRAVAEQDVARGAGDGRG